MNRLQSLGFLGLVLLLHAGVVLGMLWLPEPVVAPRPAPSLSGVLIREQTKREPAEVTPPHSELPLPVNSKPKPKQEPKHLAPRPKPVARSLPVREPAPMPSPQPVVENVSPPTESRRTEASVVMPPRVDAHLRNNSPPVYPSLSRRRGEEGVVILELLILPDGSVNEIHVRKSSGYRRLDQAALKAVSRWRYRPATKAGVAIAYRYLQPVRFSLRN